MPQGKKAQAEQIIPKLREVEVKVGRWKTVAEAVVAATTLPAGSTRRSWGTVPQPSD